MQQLQVTLSQPIEFSGIALHSGRATRTRLSPQPENSGITFHRSDINQSIRAKSTNVQDTRLATTLGTDEWSVGTVEHLLSALAALSVDNLCVEVDGPELPILDGSAAPWMLLLTDGCGLSVQQVPKKQMRVTQKVEVSQDGGWAMFSPLPSQQNTPRYDVQIDFPHAVVRRSGAHYVHTLSAAEYEEEISRARTFCYVNDVEYMRKNRRALGGSLKNAVVFDDLGVLNAEGLRYPDEFVRHKTLDAVGDCYINGCLILAEYQAKCPGHALNHALVSRLLDSPDCWQWQ